MHKIDNIHESESYQKGIQKNIVSIHVVIITWKKVWQKFDVNTSNSMFRYRIFDIEIVTL